MLVILVRHAIAEERNPTRWEDDAKRPLTPAGKKRFRKTARGLVPLVPRGAVVLTSPFVRARETAELLAATAKLRLPIVCEELASGQPEKEAFKMLAARREKYTILVGHEPHLGRLLAAALAGDGARFNVQFKKGGAACVEFRGRIVPGQARLHWFLPPKVLRALR